MEDHDTFANLLAVIADYQSSSEQLSQLDNFSAHFEPLRNAIKTLPERKGAHFRQTAERFASTLERFMFVSLVCRRKIDAINLLIRSSVESKNAIALAQGVRSLVEHVAVEAQIVVNMAQFADRLKGQTDGPKIHDALAKAEVFLQRCYFGRSPKVETNKVNQALHINDCIETLEAESPGVSAEYDFLCEFVHPNHGSNSLVSNVELNTQLFSIVTDLDRSEVKRMGGVARAMLRSCENLEFTAFSRIAILGGYAQRFQQADSKLSNVFAVRKVKPVGNGKSKETAYHFPTARDSLESKELWFSYLEGRSIKVLHRELAAMEGSSAYDMYQTTQGTFWHRVDYSAEIDDGQL